MWRRYRRPTIHMIQIQLTHKYKENTINKIGRIKEIAEITSCHTIVLTSSESLIVSTLAIYSFSSSSNLLPIPCVFIYSIISGLLSQQSKGTSSPPRWRYWSGNTCTISENRFRTNSYNAGFVGSMGPSLPFGFLEESEKCRNNLHNSLCRGNVNDSNDRLLLHLVRSINQT